MEEKGYMKNKKGNHDEDISSQMQQNLLPMDIKGDNHTLQLNSTFQVHGQFRAMVCASSCSKSGANLGTDTSSASYFHDLFTKVHSLLIR